MCIGKVEEVRPNFLSWIGYREREREREVRGGGNSDVIRERGGGSLQYI